MRNKYNDGKGRILYVGRYYRGFTTVYLKVKNRNYETVRLEVSELPVRDTWEQAQEDLDRYAENKELPAYGDDITCKYLYGTFEQAGIDYIQCGTRTYLRYDNRESFNNKLNEICKGNHVSCRAYCFRELESQGFEPKSYWHTEKMQDLLRQVSSCTGETSMFDVMMKLIES